MRSADLEAGTSQKLFTFRRLSVKTTSIILATGSSTLAATRKFRDSLTGRKREIHLTPVLAHELAAFGIQWITWRGDTSFVPSFVRPSTMVAQRSKSWHLERRPSRAFVAGEKF